MISRRRKGRPGAHLADGHGYSPKLHRHKSRTKGLSARTAFLILAAVRLVSARWNLVHDCDEVFNYWEPLHYLLYGYGMQTWEYSAEFALRPYLYLLLHAIVALPAALIFGPGTGKVAVFYATKAGLGLLSALTEAWLYRATQKYAGATAAHYLLAMLAASSGLFAASTALLPSSFAMAAMTAAAAAVLESRPLAAELCACVGIVWGWPVAGVAFLPYALWVLCRARLGAALAAGAGGLAATLGPMLVLDRLFYGKWTFSLWNFIRYNVVGGGDSALYGVEGPAFYLHNGALNLNLALVLALVFPALWLAQKLRAPGEDWHPRLLVAVSPIYLWLLAITSLPHKEERFLYVVYPLVCLAAAACCAILPPVCTAMLHRLVPRRAAQGLGWAAPLGGLALFAALSLSRTAALLGNYSAPMHIYRQLPPVTVGGPEVAVCVGAEWYRYPSSFFLPSPQHRLHFVKSGFGGLLPRAFDPAEGGTAAAPLQLNDRNRAEPANYWNDTARCDYLVDLEFDQDPSPYGLDNWEVVASESFLDAAQSPPISRAFYFPGFSEQRNRHGRYRLLKRRGKGH